MLVTQRPTPPLSTAKLQPELHEAARLTTVDTPAPPLSSSNSTDPAKRPSFSQRVEAFISRLSTRNNFWHKVCSLIWLPYAFRSGIAMKRLDNRRFRAVLPFKRVNRNWYNAMAGAALLGNSEVAAGMYLFSECGSDYIVVCKQMTYRFLRPCFGPAIYEVVNSEDVKEKIAMGGEFNIALQMEIRQQLKKRGKELRVGHCQITFHCTPKEMMRAKAERRKLADD